MAGARALDQEMESPQTTWRAAPAEQCHRVETICRPPPSAIETSAGNTIQAEGCSWYPTELLAVQGESERNMQPAPEPEQSVGLLPYPSPTAGDKTFAPEVWDEKDLRSRAPLGLPCETRKYAWQ